MFDNLLSTHAAVESSQPLPSELTLPDQQTRTVRSRPAKRANKKRQRSNGLGPCYQRDEDGRWVAVLNVKGVNGKRQRKAFYGKTEAEALENRLAAIKTPDAFTTPTTNQTVAEWLTQWLAIVKPELAESSYLDYAVNVNKYLIPGLGKRKLAELKALDVKLWLTEMQEKGATSAKVRRLAMILKLAYNRAVELDVLPASQIKKLKLPKHKAPEMKVWDEAQLGRFLEACAGDPMEPLFVLLFDAGMRIGEVLGLHWEYLTLEVIERHDGPPVYRGTVKVRHALKEVRGRASLGTTKTEAGKREITLAEETVRQLLAHKDRMIMAGRIDAANPSGSVFLTRRGTPLRKKSVYPTFWRLTEKAGLPRIRVHDARHTVASILLANGINAVAIRDTLGHTDIKVTLGTYAHLMKATDTRRSSIMNDVLTRRNRKES